MNRVFTYLIFTSQSCLQTVAVVVVVNYLVIFISFRYLACLILT